MQELHPLSPEARRKRLAAARDRCSGTTSSSRSRPGDALEIVKRVAIGVYNDGFIHAGNLAYLSMLALFPFFILAAAIAQLLGQSRTAQKTVATILSRLPAEVADVLAGPIQKC